MTFSIIPAPLVPITAGAMAVADCFSLQPATRTVLLVTNVVDDSGSIRDYGNTQAIQRGYNESLDVLAGDTEPRQIFVSTLLINRGWLYRGKSPAEAPRLDDGNYAPHGSTPLFPAVLTALDFVSQAAEYLVARGIAVYSITNVITDGDDTTHQPPSVVHPVVERMQAGGQHIVAGIAVRDDHTDFHRVFTDMGIAEQWIKVMDRRPGDVQAGVAGTVSRARETSTASAGAWHATTSMGFGAVRPHQGGGAGSPPPKVIVAQPTVPPPPQEGGRFRAFLDAIIRKVRGGKR